VQIQAVYYSNKVRIYTPTPHAACKLCFEMEEEEEDTKDPKKNPKQNKTRQQHYT
jgi:hypothetical protein